MVKDLGIKTYCTNEALDRDVERGEISSDECAKDIDHEFFE